MNKRTTSPTLKIVILSRSEVNQATRNNAFLRGLIGGIAKAKGALLFRGDLVLGITPDEYDTLVASDLGHVVIDNLFREEEKQQFLRDVEADAKDAVVDTLQDVLSKLVNGNGPADPLDSLLGGGDPFMDLFGPKGLLG